MSTLIEKDVGPDKVNILGERVIIYAKREMADWTVRENCRVPIFFEGKKYYLKRKTAGPIPYAFNYELAPWNATLGAESSRVITYDADYVAQREWEFKGERQINRIYPALAVFYPFLGLFWSNFKQRVLSPLGFDPVSITGASVMLVFTFMMVETVFVGWFRLGFIAVWIGWKPLLWVDRALVVLLPIDCLIRYGQLLDWDHAPEGFMEWAYRLIFKKRR